MSRRASRAALLVAIAISATGCTAAPDEYDDARRECAVATFSGYELGIDDRPGVVAGWGVGDSEYGRIYEYEDPDAAFAAYAKIEDRDDEVLLGGSFVYVSKSDVDRSAEQCMQPLDERSIRPLEAS